jgi:hypothetical protein
MASTRYTIELPADSVGQKTSSVPTTEAVNTQWTTPVHVTGTSVQLPTDLQTHSLQDTTPLPVKTISAVAEDAFSVTTNDTTTFAATKGLFIGVAGDVKVKMKNGTAITFTGLSAGIIHPISVTMVYATGTTALNIVGVY